MRVESTCLLTRYRHVTSFILLIHVYAQLCYINTNMRFAKHCIVTLAAVSLTGCADKGVSTTNSTNSTTDSTTPNRPEGADASTENADSTVPQNGAAPANNQDVDSTPVVLQNAGTGATAPADAALPVDEVAHSAESSHSADPAAVVPEVPAVVPAPAAPVGMLRGIKNKAGSLWQGASAAARGLASRMGLMSPAVPAQADAAAPAS